MAVHVKRTYRLLYLW